MIGQPMPIAILNRSYVSGAEQRIVSGRSDIAQVEFTSSGIGFKALVAGKFLAMWSSETLRQELSVAITSPSSAAISRNSNAWKKRSFDQIMSLQFAASGGTWNVASYSKQDRTFMPFEHVSHSWLCDLADMETCSMALTIADPTNLKWMLAVMRIPGPTEEQRNTNIIKGFSGSPTASSGVSVFSVSTYGNNGIWQIVSTINGGTIDFGFPPPRSSIAFTARFRLSPVTGSVAGSVNVAILKNTTVIASGSISIPLVDGFVDLSLVIASTEFTGQALGLRLSGIDAGERFRMEFSFDAD